MIRAMEENAGREGRECAWDGGQGRSFLLGGAKEVTFEQRTE